MVFLPKHLRSFKKKITGVIESITVAYNPDYYFIARNETTFVFVNIVTFENKKCTVTMLLNQKHSMYLIPASLLNLHVV